MTDGVAKLREKLKSREKVFATTVVNIAWSGLAQILKPSILDCLILDLEHGTITGESAEELLRMCNVLDLPTVARAADKEYISVSRVFDMGVDGVLVPRVETVAEATQIVEYARFPPRGKKGCGGFSLLRNVAGVEAFNDTKTLLIQIESRKGIENLPAMIDIGEFDGIVIGPTDLSIDLGVPLQFDSSRFREAVTEILNVCQDRRISCGMFFGDANEAEQWRKVGMNVLWVGTELVFLQMGYQNTCEAIAALQ